MVLRKVGRKTVDILVNGSQRASFTQDEDRRDYDVSVSASGSTVTFTFSGKARWPDEGGITIADFSTFSGISNATAHVSCTHRWKGGSSYQSYDCYHEIRVDNSVEDRTTTSGWSSSKSPAYTSANWIDITNGEKLTVHTYDPEYSRTFETQFEWEVDVEIDANASLNIGNVTQS